MNVLEERSFGGPIRLMKSLWNKIASDRRPTPETERMIIPLCTPQAYADGFPFGKPRASKLERENRENASR
jgi:hypothetical protein